MNELGPIERKRREGDEPFHVDGQALGFDLLRFWQWSCLARVSVRKWAPYDLKTLDGTRVEVKSAAYIQSWHQDQLSRITFRVPKTRAWDKDTNRQGEETRRQADVYVLCCSHALIRTRSIRSNVSQWEFFVVRTALLDSRKRSQHSITLPSLRTLDVLGYLAGCMSAEEILSEFPQLTQEDIQACFAYAAELERRSQSVPAA